MSPRRALCVGGPSTGQMVQVEEGERLVRVSDPMPQATVGPVDGTLEDQTLTVSHTIYELQPWAVGNGMPVQWILAPQGWSPELVFDFFLRSVRYSADAVRRL